MFKKLFGLDKTDAFHLPDPMHLTIGRSVEIDAMAYRFWPEDSLMDIANNKLNIVAQGRIDLGENVWVHRFYPDENSLMLQIRGGDGLDDKTVEEVNLWYFHDVQYPSASQSWQQMKDAIRQPAFSYAGQQFQRVWFDSSDQAEDPVSWWETIYDDREGKDQRRIFQTCMLYGRILSDDEPEFLMVILEEPESGPDSEDDPCITFMVGRHLAQHQIST